MNWSRVTVPVFCISIRPNRSWLKNEGSSTTCAAHTDGVSHPAAVVRDRPPSPWRIAPRSTIRATTLHT
eukprot:316383-Prorocentrum_minimum.AAC.1